MNKNVKKVRSIIILLSNISGIHSKLCAAMIQISNLRIINFYLIYLNKI